MASVKYGGGIIQMSGSIAGNVFARNRYANYVRARTKPTNPNTDRQNAVRSAVAFLSDRWAQTLSDDQRIAWNLYADSVNMKNRLGEVIHFSGYNHYIRSNTILKQLGYTPIDAGPVIFELPAQDPTFAVVAVESTQLLSYSFDNAMDWANEDSAKLFIFQGQPQNAQRNFFAGPWRHNYIAGGNSVTPPESPAAQAVSFAIAAGQRQWVYARILRTDGRLSEKFRADCIVIAEP